ncbi:FAD-dependent oxidoreductase [Aquisalibacillus elongatus]|uniref:FAD dependent oxidoreductase n=1 Tax=Aquisalibacillus elongatus TaxID=485577 RepID=A0A3N5BA52_9BACI|nr:FAD-dependent oxidoreductase [Aquisalibacillus elongatus]RPF54283.1 FAD dependent oxidoreductase [Aquisalibacillus elongatus]
MHHEQVDLVIIGGGLGGVAAALAACEQGLNVFMSEETDWIGGQVTSQGVPPDEHKWIESFGRTKRYQNYRESVRETYLQMLNVKAGDTPFNPGNGLVSQICHDPRVTLKVLNDQLLPYSITGQLNIHYHTKVEEVKSGPSTIEETVFKHTQSGDLTSVSAPFVIDASEEGSLLPIANMDYVVGAESKADTCEPHARAEADRNDIQAITNVLGMEYRSGEDHTIEKPYMYDFWKQFKPDFWPDQYLSLYAPHPVTKEKRQYTLFKEETGFPLWEYRRIYDASKYESNYTAGDVTLMNWPMNDYFLGNVYEVSEGEKQKHIEQSKQLSLSLLYWLQTEAPRPDGGQGYPGLMLRRDLFGTSDGLAKYPYIRESRRIKAEYTIVEQDVSPEYQPLKVGKSYEDSVGIGSYSIDLHPSMGGHNYLDIPALPFHIPLGALLPQDMENVVAGSKNIGTTHITNGCYRLHPVEWNIGEASGELIAFCLKHQVQPKEVRREPQLLKSFQNQLRSNGFELEWPAEFYEKQEVEYESKH